MTPSSRAPTAIAAEREDRAGAGAGHHGRHGEDAGADDAADDQRGGRGQPEAARPRPLSGSGRGAGSGHLRRLHGCGHGSLLSGAPAQGARVARSVRPPAGSRRRAEGRGRAPGPSALRRAPRRRRTMRSMTTIPRRLRGRRAATRAAAPPGPRAAAPHPDATAASCSSTTCSGSSGPARSTTRSPTRSRDQGVEVLVRRRPPRRDDQGRRRPRVAPRPRRHRARPRPRPRRPPCATSSRSADPHDRRQPPHRRPHRRASCPPAPWRGLRLPRSAGPTGFVLPPLPNHLFTRDTSCWIYGGVSLNPMAMPARRRETAHLEAIYRFHPLFAERAVRAWLRRRRRGPRHRHDRGRRRPRHRRRRRARSAWASAPPRRRSRRSPAACSPAAASDTVIAVALPVPRAFMHLDTVMTMVRRGHVRRLPRRPRRPAGLDPHPGRRARRARRARRSPTCSPRSRDALGLDAIRGAHHRRRRAARPSASSGTTATTSSPSRPASSSPTSATSTPTPSSARPASRSSPSPAASSAAAAADRAA